MTKFSVDGGGGEGPSNTTTTTTTTSDLRLKRARYNEQLRRFTDDDKNEDEPPIQNREEEEHQDQTGFVEPEVTETSKDAANVVFSLTEPELFDCTVCYEPLTIPVFQCENGHIACSLCCVKLSNKCPSCTLPIGYNRCRAIEKLLEAIRISCQNISYGCKEKISYSDKNQHEKTCDYSPCSCPFSQCDYLSSSKQLPMHFSKNHSQSIKHFQYEHYFAVKLHQNCKFVVFQEEKGDIFVLGNDLGFEGNAVTVSCIGHNSAMVRHAYDLMIKAEDGSTLIFRSWAANLQNWKSKPPSKTFLIVPSDFFGSSSHATLCIRLYP